MAKVLFDFDGPSIVQYYDEEWNTFIDFNEEDGGKQKKFKIVVKEGFQTAQTVVVEPIVINIPSPSPTKRRLEWPTNLILNEEVISINVLKCLNEGKNLNYKEKNLLIYDLVQYISKFTIYPSSDKYDCVAKTLIETFPQLEETIGNGFLGWKQKLRDHFKNMRRNMQDYSPVKRKKISMERANFQFVQECLIYPKVQRSLKVYSH